MTLSQDQNRTAERIPEPPLPPRVTRIEQGTWAVYAVVAILLIAIPFLTHSFGLPDIAAWVLLLGTVAMTIGWMRSGALRAPEWLKPDDYERFLASIQRVPEATLGEPAPPKPTGRPGDPGRSGVPPPAP
ncbi:MAG: hypothetical protein WB801_10195 [Candidatus Dormiibacterota bacterium]